MVRRNQRTGERAFYRCYSPGPAPLTVLVRVAGCRWRVEEAFQTGDPIGDIVERRGLRQVSDANELGAVVDRVIAENADAAEKFRGGNESVIGFLVGQVMKASGGSANPTLAQELLRERLSG